MKLNSLTSVRSRGAHVAVLGCLAFAAQIACSDDAPAPVLGNPYPMNTSGSTNSAAGMPAATAGMPAATAGTTSTGGGGAGTAGTTSTAGTFTAGGDTATGGTFTTAGTAAGGTDATAGTTGTAGMAGMPEQPKAYCEGKTAVALPSPAEAGNPPWGWSEGGEGAQISIPMDLAVDACKTRVKDAVGTCTAWRYKPSATPTPVWVIWAPLSNATTYSCLPAEVTNIAFCAKGVKGGEKVAFGGGGAEETEVTLTDKWEVQKIAVSSAVANSFAKGVEKAFIWKIVPPEGAAVTTEFFVDKIQFVKDVPTDYCAAAN